jgi:hypothetical protein
MVTDRDHLLTIMSQGDVIELLAARLNTRRGPRLALRIYRVSPVLQAARVRHIFSGGKSGNPTTLSCSALYPRD